MGISFLLMVLMVSLCACQPHGQQDPAPPEGENAQQEPTVPETEPEIWIEIPENPIRPAKEEVPEKPTAEATPETKRYSDIQLSFADRYTLACIVWLEARGEPFEGQQAVAEVVLNRMLAPNFPDTVDEIIFAENQFPTADYLAAARPREEQYIAIDTALYGENILPVDVVFFAQYPVNKNIWGEIGGHTFCYQWWWKEETPESNK